MFSRCSLYEGTRSSQPSGTIIENSRCNSACCGTCDWTNMVQRSGSSPAASQSSSTSSELALICDVSQHAELHLLFSMIVPLGWLERVPSYKEQRENITEKDLGTYGFLGYPVLQAADILIYKGDFVPVGEDQVPHVELTREIARRFNMFYGGRRSYVFPEPQPLLTPAAKLPGTDGRKMSKSYGNTILLTDPEPVVRQKLKTMVTDPARVHRSDPGNPDVCPVGDLHKVFSEDDVIARVDVGCRTAGIGCIECKSWATDSLVQILKPMQERRKKYEENPRLAWDILEAGSERARKVASATMNEVREAMKISLDYEAPRSAQEAK